MSRLHYDAVDHVRGASLYVDDVAPPAGMLHAAVVGSKHAKGRILGIDADAARRMPGVRAVLTAADIPGQNQIGALIPDEELLAATEVAFIGHPIAIVVATSHDLARRAAAAVEVAITPEDPVVSPREAFARGDLIVPARTFACGDVARGFAEADVIVRGTCEIGGQEHLYLETQRARAIPGEGDAIVVRSSTQSPYAVQKAVGRVLGLPLHLVEVDVARLGGGFGGKEDQATAWACVAALAAHVLRAPVQIVLHRLDDLQMTGKRHPYSADWELGVTRDGDLLAFRATLLQNSGARADL